jgi:transcriptional regulator with XRE-family HTH domain
MNRRAKGTVRAVRPLDPERVCANVGRRIAELRKERGLTQEEFSVRLGTSFQWVSQLEGGRNITLHSLARIANALRVSLEELIALPKSPSRSRRVGRPRRIRT